MIEVFSFLEKKKQQKKRTDCNNGSPVLSVYPFPSLFDSLLGGKAA
jgi:hypothetical protein